MTLTSRLITFNTDTATCHRALERLCLPHQTVAIGEILANSTATLLNNTVWSLTTYCSVTFGCTQANH